MLPHVDVGDELKGIIWLNGDYMARDSEVKDLKNAVSMLKIEVETLKNKLDITSNEWECAILHTPIKIKSSHPS